MEDRSIDPMLEFMLTAAASGWAPAPDEIYKAADFRQPGAIRRLCNALSGVAEYLLASASAPGATAGPRLSIAAPHHSNRHAIAMDIVRRARVRTQRARNGGPPFGWPELEALIEESIR